MSARCHGNKRRQSRERQARSLTAAAQRHWTVAGGGLACVRCQPSMGTVVLLEIYPHARSPAALPVRPPPPIGYKALYCLQLQDGGWKRGEPEAETSSDSQCILGMVASEPIATWASLANRASGVFHLGEGALNCGAWQKEGLQSSCEEQLRFSLQLCTHLGKGSPCPPPHAVSPMRPQSIKKCS